MALSNFVVDTVATSHLCTSIEYLSDVIFSESTVCVAGGKMLRAIGTGNFKCSAVDQDGNPWPIILMDVLCVPDLEVNVLSVNQLMQNGADVSFKEFHAHLSVGKTKSYFARGIDGRLVWPLEPDRTEAKRRRNCVRSTIKKRLPKDLSARSKPVGPQKWKGTQIKNPWEDSLTSKLGYLLRMYMLRKAYLIRSL